MDIDSAVFIDVGNDVSGVVVTKQDRQVEDINGIVVVEVAGFGDGRRATASRRLDNWGDGGVGSGRAAGISGRYYSAQSAAGVGSDGGALLGRGVNVSHIKAVKAAGATALPLVGEGWAASPATGVNGYMDTDLVAELAGGRWWCLDDWRARRWRWRGNTVADRHINSR